MGYPEKLTTRNQWILSLIKIFGVYNSIYVQVSVSVSLSVFISLSLSETFPLQTSNPKAYETSYQRGRTGWSWEAPLIMVTIDPYILSWQQSLPFQSSYGNYHSCDIMKKTLVTQSWCEALPPEPISLWSTAILWNPLAPSTGQRITETCIWLIWTKEANHSNFNWHVILIILKNLRSHT
jgi:hypothetical protein